jgi:hypothetical protein
MNSEPVIEFSQSRSLIAKALLSAQGALKPLVKKTDNTYYGTRYAELADVIDASKPALEGAEIVLIQGAAASEDGCAVNIETMLLHAPSCEWVRTVLRLKPSKSDAQGIGGAITYGRRYSLQALLGLAAQGDDDDGNSADGHVQAPKHSSTFEVRKAPVPAHVNGEAKVDHGEGEWIEGQLGHLQISEKDLGLAWVDIGAVKAWTRDMSVIKKLKESEGIVVKAFVRKKRTSHQLLSFSAMSTTRD